MSTADVFSCQGEGFLPPFSDELTCDLASWSWVPTSTSFDDDAVEIVLVVPHGLLEW